MKKILLVLVAVACTVSIASAQKKSFSFDWKSMYRGEVNVGFAATASHFKAYSVVPGQDGGGDAEWGSMLYSTRANGAYAGDVNTVFSRAFVETIHGFQFNDYIFAGVGVGLQYYCGKLHDFQGYADAVAMLKGKSSSATRWNALALPIFADVRGMYPLKSGFTPFINLGIGGTPVFNSAINYSQSSYTGALNDKVRLRGGLYCDFGGGVRWKDYSLSIGLQHQTLKVATINTYGEEKVETQLKMKTNAFYVKLGYSF